MRSKGLLSELLLCRTIYILYDHPLIVVYSEYVRVSESLSYSGQERAQSKWFGTLC